MTHKKNGQRTIHKGSSKPERNKRPREKKERGVIISFTYCSNQIKESLSNKRNT